MFDRKYILEKMSERGFTYSYENGDKSYVFGSVTRPFYFCTVTSDGHFQFQYTRLDSVNILQSPMCGSFDNDKHFESLRRKFEREATVLDTYCN